MSATPETDMAERMAFGQEYMVPSDFARKLERERDEARGIIQRTTEARNSALHDLTETERERDEAREVLKEIASATGFDNIGNWARNTARKALEDIK